MVLACNLGFPRIGARRELKKALEAYWSGQSTLDDLLLVGKQIREKNWIFQKESGLDHIPSNDFSFYDQVLDAACMVGAIPERFRGFQGNVDPDTYFFMARGASSKHCSRSLVDSRPMEMTKWFNTNYHYIVPELSAQQKFALTSTKCVDEFLEAKALGIITRPVLLGPISFLLLSKMDGAESSLFANLDDLLVVYSQVLGLLESAGAEWVQLDEPCLSVDQDMPTLNALARAYGVLCEKKGSLQILLATYFGRLGANMDVVTRLPVSALHLDLINAHQELDAVLVALPKETRFSAGIIDGHNVWKADLTSKIEILEKIGEKIGVERLMVAPSCSLLHVPIDAACEGRLDSEISSWLSFAKQKVEEVSLLTDALCCGKKEIAQALAENQAAFQGRKNSTLTNNPQVKGRLHALDDKMYSRKNSYVIRRKRQEERFHLPVLSTTTIGSFPQTKAIRDARKELRAGRLTPEEYDVRMRKEIDENVTRQHEIGLDVLVHGEPERNDMVEYFAELLEGFAVTEYGWVQSYGSRCVKPPIVFGDVSRRGAMTVPWAVFAQTQSKRPVKGMLTGPVTMLQWSFVRDDQPRQVTCRQLALAIRDEVQDLEAAGIGIIQIDEPAIREGLPLNKADWQDYLSWAVRCFRLASSVVRDETQIHTHMCYSEFDNIIQAIADMDADVISMEAARSGMDLLDSIGEHHYPNEIGPGIYDIHSPLIANQEEMEKLIRKALSVIPAQRLWINPDCGLKTRRWEEVMPSLQAMVSAAKKVRNELVSCSIKS